MLGLRKIKKYGMIVLSLAFIISLISFLSSEFIIYSLVGESYKDAIIYLQIAWVPFVVASRDTLGKRLMLNMGMKSEFMKIFICAFIFSVVLSFIFVPNYFAWEHP